jgi:hypothetical protein
MQESPLDTADRLVRLGFIGVLLAAVTLTFAYLDGWLTPNDLTSAHITTGFEQVESPVSNRISGSCVNLR